MARENGKKLGDWRNCQFSGSTNGAPAGQVSSERRRSTPREFSRRRQSWSMWVAARWIPGGSTGVRQSGQCGVRPKEGGVIRSRNNDEREKEEMRGNLTSCFSLFSIPKGLVHNEQRCRARERKRKNQIGRTLE